MDLRRPSGTFKAPSCCPIYLGGAKGAVGLSLYSTATVARFAPAVARAIGSKLEEWRVADKYVVVKTVVVEQATRGVAPRSLEHRVCLLPLPVHSPPALPGKHRVSMTFHLHPLRPKRLGGPLGMRGTCAG